MYRVLRTTSSRVLGTRPGRPSAGWAASIEARFDVVLEAESHGRGQFGARVPRGGSGLAPQPQVGRGARDRDSTAPASCSTPNDTSTNVPSTKKHGVLRT